MIANAQDYYHNKYIFWTIFNFSNY